MERKFKGIWIPKEIWLSKELKLLEKCLLAEISSLSDEEEGCFASNKYLCEFLCIEKGSVANLISKLSKAGYLSVVFTQVDEVKKVTKRSIRLTRKGTGGSLVNEGGGSLVNEGMVENTSLENRIDNKIPFVNSPELTLPALSDSYLHFEAKKGEIIGDPTPPAKTIRVPSDLGEASKRVPPPEQAKKQLERQAVEIISYLNEKAGRNFPLEGKRADGNKKIIVARLKEGYTADELKRIIDSKAADWFEDAKMREFIRPATLFCPKHIGDYLEKANREKPKTRPATDPDGLVFDCDLNGQADSFRSWWRRTKEAYPNIAAEIRFFSASEFKRFTADVPDWFPMLHQRFGSQRYKSMIQTAFQELECDPKRKFSAQGGLFSYLTNYFLQQA